MSRPAAAVSFVLAASLILTAESAFAQQGLIDGLTTILDINFSSISMKTTSASGGTTTTSSDNFFPRLTLNTDTLLYPNLRLSAGGVFEINRLYSLANASDADVTITRLRPFFDLRSTNPIFSPGISYFRREDRTRTAGELGLNLVSEDYGAHLGWRPEGLPYSDFRFVRTNTFDSERLFQDITKDFGQVLSRYTYRSLNAYYQGSYLDTTDREHGVETRQVSNSGRVDYSMALFARRLQWNATYNVNRQDLTSSASGDGGEVALPVIPFAGLSLLSDTPVRATLSENPLLVDGNLTAAAGVDLGLPAPGVESEARNIGLDFSSPTEVNRLLIWIDRELPADIANSFSWEVYSSVDNLIWNRETLVSRAPFGPFENRFQVDFSSVTARYIKVVTRPLSGAVLDATRFPDIFVAEVQAFLTRSAGEVRGSQVRTTQNLNTDLRLRLLDTPLLYYEGSYWVNDVDPSDSDRDTLSNGLSVTHRFNPIIAAYGRTALEQGTQPEGHRVATVTNATLTLTPVRTLTTSLLYTGQDERIDDRPNDRRAFTVQTNTQLYRGVDLQFGFGWNFTTREAGEELRDRLLNLTASVVPRQNLTLVFHYVDTETARSGTFDGDPRLHTRRGYLTFAFDPISTLHLVLGEEVLAISNERTRITTDVGVNWSPFPDGSLQFFVAYHDALRPLEFGTERSFQPAVRWRFSRQSYVEVSYQRLRSEFILQTTESKIFSVNLKWFL